MPRSPVPDSFRPLLTEPILGHLATIGPDGHPEVNPVWFLWENGQLLLSVKPETRKYRNLRADPHLALSILDPTDPYHALELRGMVTDFTLFTTLDFVNLLARKYTGADFASGSAGEERYRLTVTIDRWTGK